MKPWTWTLAVSAFAASSPAAAGQFLELQFHLVEKPLAAPGARPEHLALHLGDYQLKVFDLCFGDGGCGTQAEVMRVQARH